MSKTGVKIKFSKGKSGTKIATYTAELRKSNRADQQQQPLLQRRVWIQLHLKENHSGEPRRN